MLGDVLHVNMLGLSNNNCYRNTEDDIFIEFLVLLKCLGGKCPRSCTTVCKWFVCRDSLPTHYQIDVKIAGSFSLLSVEQE